MCQFNVVRKSVQDEVADLARFHAPTASSNFVFFRICDSLVGALHIGHSDLASCGSSCRIHCHTRLSTHVYLIGMKALTNEQKQCPHGTVTGAEYISLHMLHRNASSSSRKPGAIAGGGKSSGHGTSSSKNFDVCMFRN